MTLRLWPAYCRFSSALSAYDYGIAPKPEPALPIGSCSPLGSRKIGAAKLSLIGGLECRSARFSPLPAPPASRAG